ncbi:MAG: ABC transporter permease, partial [Ktedonobacteraceae bacterium]|nr:ABC transporter permease [Ktedonobacteraceae bacterium]
MAVPTDVRREAGPRSLVSGLSRRLRSFGAALGRPLFAILLAMIAGGIVIFATSQGGADERFFTILNAYQSLFTGSFGDMQSLSYTLIRVGALILTGISVALAFRVGLFNIGAQGQLAVGAMTAGIIAFTMPGLPGFVMIPLMIVGSALAGAIWGGIVGLLKAWRGAHEVVTTIMLNWIAFYLCDYFINGPFKAPQQANQTSSIPLQGTLPSISLFYNNTLGHFLPPISQPDQYLVDVSFFFALLGLVVYWFITRRTTFGYEMRVIGQNIGAARYAGIRIGRNMVVTMALAGAFAGLAGSFHLMGQFPYQLIGTTFSTDPTGFDAIGVSLLGNNTATGMLLASLLFGGLRQGSTQMQLNANIPVDLVFIIQALVLFSIASEFLPAILRALPAWVPFSRKPALAVTGSTTVAKQNGDSAEKEGVTVQARS